MFSQGLGLWERWVFLPFVKWNKIKLTASKSHVPLELQEMQGRQEHSCCADKQACGWGGGLGWQALGYQILSKSSSGLAKEGEARARPLLSLRWLLLSPC